jgi:3-hydroxybutyryl-CoA dehydrogenase
MDIKHIAIIGAGTMGHGIAQVCATTGYQVTLIDIVPEQLERAMASIKRSVDKLHSKGRLSDEQREAALSNITTAGEVATAVNADFVVEAAVEDLDIKRQIFAELDELTRPEVILASNTSSISLTELAAVTGRPDQVIGMHFMNPVPLMKRSGGGTGQDPCGSPGLPRFHLQPHPLPDDQRGHLRANGRRGHGGGD